MSYLQSLAPPNRLWQARRRRRMIKATHLIVTSKAMSPFEALSSIAPLFLAELAEATAEVHLRVAASLIRERARFFRLRCTGPNDYNRCRGEKEHWRGFSNCKIPLHTPLRCVGSNANSALASHTCCTRARKAQWKSSGEAKFGSQR